MSETKDLTDKQIVRVTGKPVKILPNTTCIQFLVTIEYEQDKEKEKEAESSSDGNSNNNKRMKMDQKPTTKTVTMKMLSSLKNAKFLRKGFEYAFTVKDTAKQVFPVDGFINDHFDFDSVCGIPDNIGELSLKEIVDTVKMYSKTDYGSDLSEHVKEKTIFRDNASLIGDMEKTITDSKFLGIAISLFKDTMRCPAFYHLVACYDVSYLCTISDTDCEYLHEWLTSPKDELRLPALFAFAEYPIPSRMLSPELSSPIEHIAFGEWKAYFKRTRLYAPSNRFQPFSCENIFIQDFLMEKGLIDSSCLPTDVHAMVEQSMGHMNGKAVRFVSGNAYRCMRRLMFHAAETRTKKLMIIVPNESWLWTTATSCDVRSVFTVDEYVKNMIPQTEEIEHVIVEGCHAISAIKLAGIIPTLVKWKVYFCGDNKNPIGYTHRSGNCFLFHMLFERFQNDGDMCQDNMTMFSTRYPEHDRDRIKSKPLYDQTSLIISAKGIFCKSKEYTGNFFDDGKESQMLREGCPVLVTKRGTVDRIGAVYVYSASEGRLRAQALMNFKETNINLFWFSLESEMKFFKYYRPQENVPVYRMATDDICHIAVLRLSHMPVQPLHFHIKAHITDDTLPKDIASILYLARETVDWYVTKN